jgi:hypothetical protein
VRDAEPNSALDEKHIEIREEIHLVACWEDPTLQRDNCKWQLNNLQMG